MPDDAATLPADEAKTPRKRASAKPLPGEDGFKPDHRGPQPHFPIYGETWQETPPDGTVKFWHGSGWYLEAPGKPAEERAAEMADAEIVNNAIASSLSASQTGAVDESGDNSDSVAQGEAAPILKAVEGTDLTIEEIATIEDYLVGTSPAVERMELVASDYELGDTRFLVASVRDFLIEQIKMRPKPWSATPEGEQRDVIAACEHAGVELVRKIVEGLATQEKQPIRALVDSYNEKDGTIKVSLKVRTFSPEESLAAIVGLHEARGKNVLLTIASVDDYKGERAAATDPDQPDLSFAAGTDHPDDDSDLAGADDSAE